MILLSWPLSSAEITVCYTFPPYLKGKQLFRFHPSSLFFYLQCWDPIQPVHWANILSVLALQTFLLMLLVVATTQLCFDSLVLVLLNYVDRLASNSQRSSVSASQVLR